jgi:hypothetical protein
MATTADMPIPSNYNPTGVGGGDPNNEIARLQDLQSFVPGANNSQARVLGLTNNGSPFTPSNTNITPITPMKSDPADVSGGPMRTINNNRRVNQPIGNITVPLNPQGNGGLGVSGAGGYAPGLSVPGVPVATGQDYGVPVTVAAMSGTKPVSDNGNKDFNKFPKFQDPYGITDGLRTANAAQPALSINSNLAPNKTAPVSVSNMSPTAQAVMGVNNSAPVNTNAPASGVRQTAIPGAGAGTPAPIAGPTNIYGYPTSGPTSSNGTYTGPTVGGGLDPRLHDELTKTYGDGFGNTLWNTLQSGAGFNPAIANAFIKEMQPIFQENLANAMEYFSSTGSRFSSAAALGAGKAVADFSAKQQAVFAQMYMWAYQNYLNVLQYGATNTGDNTFGNIRSILGLLQTAGKGIQGGDFGGTAGTIGDVLAGL